jgi:hypothetical protein
MGLDKRDIDWLLDSLSRPFVTKDEFKDYSERVITKLDMFIGEIKTKREE